ncbi:12-oxophytodienoate reductase, partial [Actinosynnema sp. NPDC023658]|uniref:oxidoreductase n=1 Tax=Actinosynnema sp. NPDC023658 TaxID=3155465 RepID=UPI0033D97405
GGTRGVDDPPEPGVAPVAPSGVTLEGRVVAEPMSDDDIGEVIGAFARAAADARRLGFDGIELHGGHGYLIDQFLWSDTNHRGDRYGIDPSLFASEVVAACRAAVGPGFPISFRLSQWKISDFGARLAHTPEELGLLLAPLVEAGVDVFHCSTRRFWLPEFPGSGLGLAGWVKKVTGLPTITVGSVGLDNSEFQSAFIEGRGAANALLDGLVEMFERDEFDLVAVARALLADPEWATKIRDGRLGELVPFTVGALAELV